MKTVCVVGWVVVTVTSLGREEAYRDAYVPPAVTARSRKRLAKTAPVVCKRGLANEGS